MSIYKEINKYLPKELIVYIIYPYTDVYQLNQEFIIRELNMRIWFSQHPYRLFESSRLIDWLSTRRIGAWASTASELFDDIKLHRVCQACGKIFNTDIDGCGCSFCEDNYCSMCVC